MDMKLTRDAEKLATALYKSYLEKRESGQLKHESKLFYPEKVWKQYFPKENEADFEETLNEFLRAVPCKRYVDGEYVLCDAFIIYMENRFKNGLKDVISFLTQFIP